MSATTAQPAGKSKGFKALVPVMSAFFVMGFVDLVGTATNYIKPEFNLSDSQTNLFTTMVFFWFFIFSVPTGVMMHRIGKRKTAVLSIVVTLFAMLLPILAYLALSGTARLWTMIVSFILLGVGNTIMQVALNPLMTLFVKGDKLASTLTTGQFVKGFASFFAPIIAGWGFSQLNHAWWVLYVIYLIIGVVVCVALWFDQIEEPAEEVTNPTIIGCLKLLGNRVVLLCFLGIVCHVGIDVGINAQAPRILMEHTGVPLAIAGGATSVYFAFRTLGCFTGSIVLQRMSNKLALRICGGILVLSAICFGVFSTITNNPPQWLFYVAVALVGFGNSNVFSLFLSQALLNQPKRQNEVSGLMIMGLIGGALFPPIMGAASDAMGQIGSIIIMAIGVAYVMIVGLLYRLLETRKAA
ncbi:MFS transporter [Bifidobacterium subtile]|jgi:fucose permease|uniref:Sugar transport protein n=1 Tax=Bifidobacterium subtile TaxID=77635 RepID=A0A087E0F7_9BIFI|nr:MFS transporter [Bifidobacterium subtile]KFJ01258.1 sugar transport protein [Bifidobacterium subtile]MCI1223391.1 MFS transporter [Bifidobacterium subtile]QOL37047.1 MFS transporter [Bifidobacterium subtile]